MKKISFVIPCYRSEKTLPSVTEEIKNKMETLTQYSYEIILVNDGSPDGTYDVISKLVKESNSIIGVDLAKNSGQHAALMAGFRICKGDYVVCLDDDGQTPACEVDKLLLKIEEGYDVVYASYNTKQHSSFRNLGSKVNSKMTETMLGKPKDLFISSYFAAKRFIVDEMIRYEGAFPYVIGLILRSTKNICNVPVTHRQRETGRSGYTLAKLISLWMNGFTSFSIKPLRMANYLGIVSSFIGILYTIWIVIKHFAFGAAPAGWSSIMALMLIVSGIVLVVLGMLGEYIGRIYMCINASPQYVIREVITNEKD